MEGKVEEGNTSVRETRQEAMKPGQEILTAWI